MKLKSSIFSQILYLISCVLILVSCDSTEPGKETLSLSLEDASSTEVWLKLNGSAEGEYVLQRDGMQVQQISLSGTDNIIYNDSLKPSTTYTYQLIGIQDQSASNKVTALTMDTISHDFTWETFTFGGQGGSSTLYDVAIIDENNIWAVGEIYTANDTYNAVHWDGNGWELKKIANSSYPRSTVYAFNEKDIWFDGTIQWDGYTYSVHNNGFPLDPNGHGWRRNAMWGKSSSDFYVVGNNGNIAHYNGNSWEKIVSGTSTHINDAWGVENNQNQTVVYCPVSSFFVPGEKKVLKIVDKMVETVPWNKNARIYSVWAKSESILYVCGEGVFENKFGRWNEINLQPIGTNSIRGNGLNDIFVVGDYGSKFHFNGSSWRLLNSFNSSKGYSKVAILNNLVVVCGNQQGQGLIEIGIRQ
ncbi:MAG: glucosyl transferase [Melioribacteraceae bacterium]|nr:glucosyl transferase [Melioribacteraceae bacterium]